VQPALRVIHSHSGPSYASSFANIYSTNIYSDLWNMKPYHSYAYGTKFEYAAC